MADPEDPESWYSQFKASGAFGDPVCQINGLGEIPAVQAIYVAHVKAVVDQIA
jgi:cobalamin biosynthesis Co2+ chelatase CbiK